MSQSIFLNNDAIVTINFINKKSPAGLNSAAKFPEV